MERLSAKNITFAFGYETILENINFELKKGEVLSIVGPSGAGKTTLLHLCANLLDMDEGILENTFTHSAFAFQDPRLLPWKNTIDNIALGLRAKGVKTKEAIKKAQEIALKFGLEEDDFDKFPKDLSGGMKQRVSFARALVTKPELLFLDEPFSALDIGLKKEMQTHLIRQIEEEKMTVFFITHDLMEAIRLSDRIILLEADPGRVINTFHINKPRTKRDDVFVYNETAKMLANADIIKTFELESA